MAGPEALQAWAGRAADPSTAIVGLGNPDRGDDGIGVAVARQIRARFCHRIFFEGEQRAESVVLDFLESETIRTVLFIDAADFGGKPGEIRWFDADAAGRFLPAVSTHKVPLNLLMELLRGRGKQSFLLAVQPESTEFLAPISRAARRAMDGLEKALNGYCYPDHKKCIGKSI